MANGALPNLGLEAYKLEYQLAAGRYENIYKAIWQIFSYLAAVTGVLVTFGSAYLQTNFLLALASFPLFFWYLSTFLPMNRYGDFCLKRLAAVEADINGLSGSNIQHYKDFQDKRSKGFRVRGTVHILGLVLGLVFVVNGYKSVWASCSGIPPFREKPPETKLISLSADELKKLMQQSAPAGQATQEAKSAKSINQTPTVRPKAPPLKTNAN